MTWERLQRHISGWFPPQGAELHRCAVLEQCIRMGKTQPRPVALTVHRGGKDGGSLAFALAQARARGCGGSSYVIPYTSIIEQTAQEFRTILGGGERAGAPLNAAYENRRRGHFQNGPPGPGRGRTGTCPWW